MKQIKKRAENQRSQPTRVSPKEDEHGINFIFPQDLSVGIIKVVGVGGGGCNAVRNMYLEGITNVTYAAFNTDSQQLVRCPVPVKLQLGADGLGAGGNPDKGREEAEQTRDRIRTLLDDGTKMVFVTASMGGGTGTGAAPIVAQVAKEMGLLTIGIVTIPFSFEGQQKIMKALRGMEEMRKNVDALLVVQNDKLTGGAYRELPDGQQQRIPMKEKFKMADNILKDAAKSISELITLHCDGDINLDFRDVETTMKNGGDAIMAAGRAGGEHRVKKAIVQALDSPLLYGSNIGRARRILFDIYTSDEEPLYNDELQDIEDFMLQLDPDIEVIWGTSTDNSLGKDAKVIILAAGMAHTMQPIPQETAQQDKDDDYFRDLMRQLYTAPKAPVRTVVERELEFKDDEEEENEELQGAQQNSQQGNEQDNEKVDENVDEEVDEHVDEQETVHDNGQMNGQEQADNGEHNTDEDELCTEPSFMNKAVEWLKEQAHKLYEWLMNLTKE